MTFEQAMIVIRKPGWFKKSEVQTACDFIIKTETPKHISPTSHSEAKDRARICSWANAMYPWDE